MQISTSQLYDRSTTLMQQLSQKADTLQTQIGSTKRLSAPSQDVVAYQRLATIKQANADGGAYASNIGLAQSLLQQSDTTLSAVETQIQRAQEYVVQANNGALSEDNRKVISTQLKAIVDDLVGLANTVDTRGQPLFGAATGDSAVTKNADGSVSFTGTGEPSAIPVGDDSDVQATDSAARVFGGVPNPDGTTTDVFAIISKFAAALDAGGDVSGAAAAAGDALKASFAQVTSVHGSVGARGTRLDLEASQVKDAATTREIDRSALEDTDVTTAISELQKTMTILSATQASFTKLAQLSLFNYLN